MVNYWIFIARRKEGDLHEMRSIIKNRMWDFVSKDLEPKTPQFHKELSIGDFVLFYLADTYPDGKKIEGGRSIMGKARLGSPYIIYGEYIGNDEPVECFVFLLEPDTKFNKDIEPRKYGIGFGSAMVVKISKKDYDNIVD